MAKKKRKKRLVTFIRRLAAKSKESDAFVRKMRNYANKLEDYEKHIGKKLYTQDFNYERIEDYIYYLKTKKPYRTSTMRAFISKIKEYLSKARECGYKVNSTFAEVKLPADDYEGVALTNTEVNTLLNMKGLTKTEERIRAWFVFDCACGLRYSDLSTILEITIKEDYFRLKTQKTKTGVVIPKHYIIVKLLEKHGGKMPPLVSAQYYNRKIKDICKKAGINKEVVIERYEGLEFKKRKYEKWQLISAHTARRTFATNAYLAGIRTARIMLITGHKTESSFFAYIKINKEENAETLSRHSFFTGSTDSTIAEAVP